MTHPLQIVRQEFEDAKRTNDPDRLARLREYFLPSDVRSRPFDAGVKLNPEKFPRPADALPFEVLVSDELIELANAIERENRLQDYRRRLDSGYSGPIIVDEGDSWFQYPFLLTETIDQVMLKYPVYSLSGAGHLLTDMRAQDEYTEVIRCERADFFLLSGGGNDLLENGRLAEFLHVYRKGMSAGDVINQAKLKAFLDGIAAIHDQMFANLTREFPALKILCHGYDYALPRKGSPWLGQPLALRRVPSSLWRDVVRKIIDAFNTSLKSMERNYRGHVYHVDCRKVVGGANNWYDELHPTSGAFARIAEQFLARMRSSRGKSR